MASPKSCVAGSLCTLATLLLIARSVPAQNTEFERAARELREALKGDKKKLVTPEMRREQRRWAQIQKRIDAEVERQDQLIVSGGEPLWKGIKEYESRAASSGDAVDHYLAGRIYGRVSNLDKAREHFERATKMDPRLFWAM